jgi:hypothetical protein
LGGIWNGAVVPDSRHGLAAWLGLAFLLLLAALGARRWMAALGRRGAMAHLILWDIGVGIAILSAAAPHAVAAVADVIPGGGLLRDGSRSLALALPATVGLVAWGTERLIGSMPRPAHVPATVALALIPIALIPDAAWGLGRQLEPADYPASWLAARTAVGTDHGDALVLPPGNYRAPSWNGHRPVIDPMGRLLLVPTVIDDDLVVGDIRIEGEDPRVRQARVALALPTPGARAAALRGLGVGWVVFETDALTDPGASVSLADPGTVAGTVILDQGDVTVVRLEGQVSPVPLDRGWMIAQVAAWLAALGVLLLGPTSWIVHRLRGRPDG